MNYQKYDINHLIKLAASKKIETKAHFKNRTLFVAKFHVNSLEVDNDVDLYIVNHKSLFRLKKNPIYQNSVETREVFRYSESISIWLLI